MAELSHALFNSNPEQKQAQDQLELYIASPVKPLGMNCGDRIKQHDLRRYEVSASLCRVQVNGRKSTVLLDSKSGGTTAAMMTTMTTTGNAIWPMQVQDWRRFDTRRITLEAQLRALEAVEKYLLGRQEQILIKAVEAVKLGVDVEDHTMMTGT